MKSDDIKSKESKRGGRRKGAGRKPGSKNLPKLQLELVSVEPSAKISHSKRFELERKKVAHAVAEGMDEQTIAAILKRDIENLRALFAHELRYGREIIRLDELMRLEMASAEGSVAASKEILKNSGDTKTENPAKPRGKNPSNGDNIFELAAARLRQ